MNYDLFGTESYKLVRRKDPLTSKEASVSVNTTKLEELVYETIKSFGLSGCTSDDLLDKLKDYRYSSITARYKALYEKKLVDTLCVRKVKSGRSQRVMVATIFVEEE